MTVYAALSPQYHRRHQLMQHASRSVEVMCIRHEDADDATQLLQRSRVLEVNTGTASVANEREPRMVQAP